VCKPACWCMAERAAVCLCVSVSLCLLASVSLSLLVDLQTMHHHQAVLVLHPAFQPALLRQ